MPKIPRSADELVASGLAVIDRAFQMFPPWRMQMAPLYSGGYDSVSACLVAAEHPQFKGVVHHIDTGIGARATRLHVEEVCKEMNWKLRVHASRATYEDFVRDRGFPGPGAHQWVYNRIKDRCVRAICRNFGAGSLRKTALITGCRSEESTRRMGHVDPIQVGEKSAKTGVDKEPNRVWVAPCHDWTREEQRRFLDGYGLPKNPVKESPIGMSGECFCGAFATPGEIDLIRQYAPDVYEKIMKLEAVARGCGTPAKWGTRPDRKKGLLVVDPTGPMCSSCDRRATAAGVTFSTESCSSEAPR